LKFKHWKEADSKVVELRTSIEAIDAEVLTMETEARDTSTDTDKRDALLADLTSRSEVRTALQTELNDVTAARDELRAKEESQFSMLNNLRSDRIAGRAAAKSTDNVLETRQYELAWARAVKTGDQTEVRQLISTPDNQMLIPSTLYNRIADLLFTGGRLISLCNRVEIKGITEYPLVNSKSDPALHDEVGGLAKKEKEILLDSVLMNPQFIAETLQITKKFEADSIEAFWNWLWRELPDALMRVVDGLILNGSQAANAGIHGILTNTDARFVASISQTPGFNTPNEAIAMLDEGTEESLALVMNRQTFYSNFMGLTGTDGHPIYSIVPGTQGRRSTFILGGYPVVFSNSLPAYATAAAGDTYMVAGDFNAYTLNFPLGMQTTLTRDPYTDSKKNLINYVSEIYAAGNITRLQSFAKVTK